MLRVLLADDEPFIAQGLTKLVDWEQEGYEVAAIAANGQEALEYLEKNSVDLIIADIKMPVMSGVELLKRLREEHISEAHFVILSGYSDFSYAQQAIRYHCLDYILKPVEKEKLLGILRKVAHMSENLRQNEENQKMMEKAYLARNVISLLIGKFDEMNLEYVKNHMQHSAGVRYVDIELGETETEEEEESVRRANQRQLYQACQTLLKEDSAHVIFDVSHDEKNYDIGFLYCDYMAAQRNSQDTEYLEWMHENLQKLVSYPVYMYVGKKVSSLSTLAKSYSTACILKSLEAFRTKKNIYYYENEVQVGNGGVLLCKKALDALIAGIERNEETEINQGVEALYREMKQLGFQMDTVNLNINYLLFQLIHLASEQDDEVNQEEILHFISESSFEDGLVRGSSVHLKRFACEYADYLALLRRNVSRGVVLEVEKEVREHYTENLSLKELGKKYFVNSSYLGQIFRKKYGQSFKDYLCNYRINEAARQLIKTDKRINQIAEDVGYKDSDYFIRKFIEIKGCTPSKYRKNEQEEESQ